MKFWQLMSVADRYDPGVVGRVAGTRDGWARYRAHADNFNALVQSQDREVLDSVVDHELVVAVLKGITQPLYLSSDRTLRSWPFDPGARPISYLDVYLRFGGDALEDALEHGSFRVDGSSRR